jgi:hypothetical protein
MADMAESGSDISIRAEKRVIDELSVRIKQHRVIARECLTSPVHAAEIEMHLYAAELYVQLVAAAPDIFHNRARAIADAEATKGEPR